MYVIGNAIRNAGGERQENFNADYIRDDAGPLDINGNKSKYESTEV